MPGAHGRDRRQFRPGPVQGIAGQFLLCLPGYFRVANFPTKGALDYEYYVPVDEDHYIYTQIMCLFPSGRVNRLWKDIKYYLWGKPLAPVMFNNQDAGMVAQTTDYVKRTPAHYYSMAKVSRNDDFHVLWRSYCNEQARGVGTKWLAEHGQAPRKLAEPAIAGGADGEAPATSS